MSSRSEPDQQISKMLHRARDQLLDFRSSLPGSGGLSTAVSSQVALRVYITIGQAWSNCHIVFAADAACLAISSGVTVRRPCSALSKIPDRSKAS